VEPSGVKRRLTCILAADAVGYSGQMGADEDGTMRVLSAHRAVIDGIIAFHDGCILSTAGDSVLAEFSSVVEAVRCAVEIQDALRTRNDALPEHRRMLFRIGVNLGVSCVRCRGAGASNAAAYDGNWHVTVVCVPTADGALGYTLEFVAQVKDGFLRGDSGIEGSSGWLRLQGPIQPDGSAKLDARGITGDRRYNVNEVAKGAPYKYTVAATFDASRGSGRRLELRACDLRFVRQ